MLSRVTSLQGLAFIAAPAFNLLQRTLDPTYVRFNKAIEANAAKTYATFQHLAPVPDKPVLSCSSSGSPASDGARRTSRASDRRCKLTHTLLRDKPTSSDRDTDDDLLPAAFGSYLQSKRQAAETPLGAAQAPAAATCSDPDVIAMDIDAEEPPGVAPSLPSALPTPARKMAPVSCLPVPLVRLPRPPPPARRRRARQTAHLVPSEPPMDPFPQSAPPPERRAARAKARPKAVQHWAMCDQPACNAWRALEAEWKRPTFNCSDAGFVCGTLCDACGFSPCGALCEK